MLREAVSSALIVVADGVQKEDGDESAPLVRFTLNERARRVTSANLEDSEFPEADIELRERIAWLSDSR